MHHSHDWYLSQVSFATLRGTQGPRGPPPTVSCGTITQVGNGTPTNAPVARPVRVAAAPMATRPSSGVGSSSGAPPPGAGALHPVAVAIGNAGSQGAHFGAGMTGLARPQSSGGTPNSASASPGSSNAVGYATAGRLPGHGGPVVNAGLSLATSAIAGANQMSIVGTGAPGSSRPKSPAQLSSALAPKR